MRISDWSSDVCSSDLEGAERRIDEAQRQHLQHAQREQQQRQFPQPAQPAARAGTSLPSRLRCHSHPVSRRLDRIRIVGAPMTAPATIPSSTNLLPLPLPTCFPSPPTCPLARSPRPPPRPTTPSHPYPPATPPPPPPP